MKIQNALILGALSTVLAVPTALAGKKDIVDTAVKAGSFKTLAAALNAAGLVEALKGDGPFTVFAPTDAAFAKLPAGTVETLLKPENKDKLVDILTYHVVSGEVPAKVAVTLDEATALNKKAFKVAKRDGGLFLNESKVIQTDIECSNGIIHVIDAVLLPPAEKAEHASHNAQMKALVHKAIAKGVPLFNHGQHEACAAIYEVTAHALMAMPESALSASQREMVHNAIMTANKSTCSSTDSWTYRRVFDSLMMASR